MCFLKDPRYIKNINKKDILWIYWYGKYNNCHDNNNLYLRPDIPETNININNKNFLKYIIDILEIIKINEKIKLAILIINEDIDKIKNIIINSKNTDLLNNLFIWGIIIERCFINKYNFIYKTEFKKYLPLIYGNKWNNEFNWMFNSKDESDISEHHTNSKSIEYIYNNPQINYWDKIDNKYSNSKDKSWKKYISNEIIKLHNYNYSMPSIYKIKDIEIKDVGVFNNNYYITSISYKFKEKINQKEYQYTNSSIIKIIISKKIYEFWKNWKEEYLKIKNSYIKKFLTIKNIKEWISKLEMIKNINLKKENSNEEIFNKYIDEKNNLEKLFKSINSKFNQNSYKNNMIVYNKYINTNHIKKIKNAFAYFKNNIDKYNNLEEIPYSKNIKNIMKRNWLDSFSSYIWPIEFELEKFLNFLKENI